MECQCTCVGVRDGAPASRSPSRGQSTERIPSLPPSRVPELELTLSGLRGKLSHLAHHQHFCVTEGCTGWKNHSNQQLTQNMIHKN